MINRNRLGYRLIFWGLLFAALHFNYGAVSALPPLFGWLMLFVGIRFIARARKTLLWKDAEKAAFCMLFITVIEFAQPFVLQKASIPSVFILLWAALKSLFSLLTAYAILAGSIESLRRGGKEETARKYEKKLYKYILFFLIVTLGDLGVIVCSSETGSIIVFAAGLALQIWLLTIVYKLRKAAALDGPVNTEAKVSQKQQELAGSGAKSE